MKLLFGDRDLREVLGHTRKDWCANAYLFVPASEEVPWHEIV